MTGFGRRNEKKGTSPRAEFCAAGVFKPNAEAQRGRRNAENQPQAEKASGGNQLWDTTHHAVGVAGGRPRRV